MIALLWWVVSAVAGEAPADGPAERISLADPAQRVSFAAGLRADASADEAAVALLRQGRREGGRSAAWPALYEIALAEPLRPGWRDIYNTLLSAAELDDAQLPEMAIRAAASAAADPASRSRGISALSTVASRYPQRTEARIALALAQLRAGRPETARAAFEKLARGPESNRGYLLALLAAGRVEDAKAFAGSAALDASDPVVRSVGGTLRDRVGALVLAGEVEVAAEVVAAEDPRLADVAAWQDLGEALLVSGDAGRAAYLLGRLTLGRLDQPQLRERWVAALLESGDVAAARAAAGSNEAAQQLVSAVSLVAECEGDVLACADAIGAAARVAPAQPTVARAYADLLLRRGEAEEAWDFLAPRIEARPNDLALASVRDRVAVATGQGEIALESHRRALRVTGAASFWPRVAAIAALHAGLGERLKEAKEVEHALDHYRVAVALEPDTAAYLSGIGGVLWSAGRIDEARDAYVAALELAPIDPAVLRSAVQVSVASGDLSLAKRILAATPLRGPEVEQLRHEVDVDVAVGALQSTVAAGLEPDLVNLLVRFPNDGAVLHAVGDSLLRLGKPAVALGIYQRARDLRPDDVWLALAEANCHIDAGSYDEAERILTAFASHAEDGAPAALRAARARLLRAKGEAAWHQQGDPDRAFAAFAEASSLESEPWSFVALGGLYLGHRQPGAALACFEEALGLDPDNVDAYVGRMNALYALGRRDDARAQLEAIGDETRDGAARAVSDPDRAFGDARRALAIDPRDGAALRAAIDAGLALHRRREVAELVAAALGMSKDSPGRASVDVALFAESVERALDVGARRRALRELDAIRETMNEDPDAWAWLGGAYLALGATDRAAAAYQRGGAIDARNVPSIIGYASSLDASGKLRDAATMLEKRFGQTGEARVGVAAAQLWERLGRWRAGLDALQAVRARDGGLGDLEPYPLVPLPSGRVIDDTPPASYEGLSARMTPRDVEQMEESLSSAHLPYAHLIGGSLGQTGSIGENRLTSWFAGAAVEDIWIGGVRLQVDALVVDADNGAEHQQGVGASVGVSSPGRRRVVVDARLGTSPIGFANGAYATWLGTIRYAVNPLITVGADTGHVPVTDSILSWVGSPEGLFFGRASYTWGGGWASLAGPSGASIGARYRIGVVDAFGMARDDRTDFTAWVGQSVHLDAIELRIGGNVTGLDYDRQIASFVPGEAGVFSPLSYLAGVVTGDLRWRAGGTTLCAGGALGVQRLQGEPQEPYFTPGVGPAIAIGAGLSAPLGLDGWRFGFDARTERAGAWWQQSIFSRIGYVPRWTRRTGFVAPSEIHGTGFDRVRSCE